MSHEGSVQKQSYSYRQGLVLGLTMAEIMLLLVFCLLIAVGAALKHGRDQLDAERSEKLRLEELLATSVSADDAVAMKALNDSVLRIVSRDQELVEAMKMGTFSEEKLTDLWKDVVAAREIKNVFGSQGLAVVELQKQAEMIAEALRAFRTASEVKSAKEASDLTVSLKRVEEAHGYPNRDSAWRLSKYEAALKLRSQETQQELGPAQKWPPIIRLSEAGGYFFPIGSAELTQNYEKRLLEVVVPQLLQAARDYEVDVIEVVGHTDEQPLGSRVSNLDKELIDVMRGTKPISALKPSDNAGLGLARSVSVIKQLLKDPRLEGMRILPLSGAQLIKTDEMLANGTDQGDIKERRRIEIRLRKSNF